MHLERFDPVTDRRHLEACYRMFEAAMAVDDPRGPILPRAASPSALDPPVRGLLQGRRSFCGYWAQGLDGNPQQTWLAIGANGEPAGCAVVELPERDNTDVVHAFVVVPPRHRRAGIGRALVAHCADEASRAGRSLLLAEIRDTTAGAAFARALGAEPGPTDLRLVLDVDAGLAPRLADLRRQAERKASGYSLVSWCGDASADHPDQVAAVLAAIADAPRPAAMAAEAWDGARVVADDARHRAQGLVVHTVAARHDDSGRLAALTQVCVDPQVAGWAFQLITAVERPHRGHNLGLLVKVAMHASLTRPPAQLRRIMTTNGGTNQHMLAVNQELGYRTTDTFTAWELPLH